MSAHDPSPPSDAVDRRTFLHHGLAVGSALALRGAPPDLVQPVPRTSATEAIQAPFELEELTIAELQEGMRTGKYTARALVQTYLGRIAAIDKHGPAVNSVIELNPDAERIAGQMDDERRAGRTRGRLHGIPVLIKDNIDTGDRMHTSAGSLALGGSTPPRDSGVAERLRAGGAVILGKTNLSEWANFRSTHSTSGWSGRGGQTKNPYVLNRNPCGSSSGTGASISANLAAVGIGTETDGSIVCPSSACGLVGIKPTVGLVSRAGVIPISHSQDTAGPMARTVADAAALLSVLTGVDPRDSATADSRAHLEADYTKNLDPAGLKGARIGVARNFFGFSARVDRIMDETIAAMKSAGAIIVDPANLATSGKYDDAELDVLLYEFKADLNAYLASLGPSAPAKTLTDLIAYNTRNRMREMPFFEQELFERADRKGPLTDPTYRQARAKCVRLARTEGIDATLAKFKLDAIVAPTGGPAWVIDLVNGDHFTGGSSTPAAVAGYASVTVPAGHVFGLPVGVSFIGGAWSEGKLIKLAYAFEQATKVRKPPRFHATAELVP